MNETRDLYRNSSSFRAAFSGRRQVRQQQTLEASTRSEAEREKGVKKMATGMKIL